MKELIARSPDLSKLDAEGYVLEVEDGYLLVRDVPYVKSEGWLARGIFIVPLNLAGVLQLHRQIIPFCSPVTTPYGIEVKSFGATR